MNFPKKDLMTSRASDSQKDPQAASKIVSVEARTITIPLENPTSFSTRQVFARDYVVVRVRTEDGHEGQGFCYGGSRGGCLVASAVQVLLKPLLIGKSALNVEGLWSEMYQETLLHGRAGSVMRAISIVDVALWDRNARAVGLPLSQYLGGTGKATVPAYASGGYYLDGKTPDKLGQEMASYVKMGFKAVKMKVGRGDLKSEEARIRAAREAIGRHLLDISFILSIPPFWTILGRVLCQPFFRSRLCRMPLNHPSCTIETGLKRRCPACLNHGRRTPERCRDHFFIKGSFQSKGGERSISSISHRVTA